MSAQFDLRRDFSGWTVFDRWTGKPVVLGLTSQIGLRQEDAEEVVRQLNLRRDHDDRRILQ